MQGAKTGDGSLWALGVALFWAGTLACGPITHDRSRPAPTPVAAAATAPSQASAPAATSWPTALQARILTPRDGERYDIGRTVSLAGEAVDASGARLSASALSWHSSLTGPLGSGSPLDLRNPTPGVHVITLEAHDPSDPSGRRAQASVRIAVAGAGGRQGQDLVSYLLGLPLALLGNPPSFPPDIFKMMAANPTDLNATSGAGGLTLGLSSAGTVTVLKWPNPSYHDQVNYLSVANRNRGFGALENMGVLAGLALSGASGPIVTWLRDPTWKTTQRYLDDQADVIVTEHEAAALGLKVMHTAFVRPDRDVYVAHYRVERLPGGPAKADLLFYENLAPCTSKLPYLPISDWQLDIANDFAAAYDASGDLVVHFRPARPDYAELLRFALSPAAADRAAVERWIAAADGRFGPGSYLALAASARADAVQVGTDTAGQAWGSGGIDAWADAADGQLGGHPFAAVRANAVLLRRLDLTAGAAEESFYLAAGPSIDGPAGARETLRWARAIPYADHLAASLAAARAWLGRARLPATTDPDVLTLARRGLLATRTAIDRAGGSIVASIATQLPYGLDWPRDGAFINRALDQAGYPELVTRHNEFYARVQRRGIFLPGTYEMNYYADGMPGGPIAFEIDNAALAVWTMCDHLDFIADPLEKARHLAVVYPAIRRGADFLAAWRDPLSKLQLPANEDDHPELTQGLQGAETIVLALEAARRAGALAGEKAAVIDGWRRRQDELRDALLARFWNAPLGRLADGQPGGAHGANDAGTGAWAIWPCPVLLAGDPRRDQQADYLWGDLSHTFSGQRSVSAYDLKSALSLAEHWSADPVKRARLADLVRRAAREMPTPGTRHLGEAYRITAAANGALTFEQLNDMPHIWEHLLFYLTALRVW